MQFKIWHNKSSSELHPCDFQDYVLYIKKRLNNHKFGVKKRVQRLQTILFSFLFKKQSKIMSLFVEK